MKKKLSLLLTLALGCGLFTQPLKAGLLDCNPFKVKKNESKLRRAARKTGLIAVGAAGSQISAISVPVRLYATALHELGHAIPASIFYPGSVESISVSANAGWTRLRDDINIRGIRAAAIYAGGPLSGLLANYALIKGLHVADAYWQQEHKDLKEAWQVGSQKSVFEMTDSVMLTPVQAAAWVGLAINAMNLIPFNGMIDSNLTISDGDHLVRCAGDYRGTMENALVATFIAAFGYGAYKVVKENYFPSSPSKPKVLVIEGKKVAPQEDA